MRKWSQGTTEPSQLRNTLVTWQPSVYIYSCYKISEGGRKDQAPRTCNSPSTRRAAAPQLFGTLDALSTLTSIFSLPKIITGKSMTDASLFYKLPDYIVLILELSFLCFTRKKIKWKGFSWRCYFVLPQTPSLASECSKF